MRADSATQAPGGASFDRAVAALGEPGSVLDVGAGVGAGGLPLLPFATSLTAVDPSEQMLTMLAERASTLGREARTVAGVGRTRPRSSVSTTSWSATTCSTTWGTSRLSCSP